MRPKLLTTSTCSRCAMAKRMLDMNNIEYDTIVLDSPEGKELSDRLNLRSVPRILSGESVIDIQDYIGGKR